MNLTDFMDTLILIWIETALGLKEKSNNNQIKALECIKSATKGQVETLLPLKSEEVCPQRLLLWMITRDWFVKQLLLPGITGAFCNTINTHPALAKRSRALYWPFIVQAIFPNQSSTTKIHSEKVNLST